MVIFQFAMSVPEGRGLHLFWSVSPLCKRVKRGEAVDFPEWPPVPTAVWWSESSESSKLCGEILRKPPGVSSRLEEPGGDLIAVYPPVN